MPQPLGFSRELCGRDDLGVRAKQGRRPADVVEVSVSEDEVTDGRLVLQAQIGHCGQDPVRACTRVDGDDSRGCLDEREVAEVVGLGDMHVRRGADRARCGQAASRLARSARSS